MSNLPYVPPPTEVSPRADRPVSKVFSVFAVILGVSAVVWFQVNRVEQQEAQARQKAKGEKVLADVRDLRDQGLKDLEKGDSTSQLKRMEKMEGEIQKFAAGATGPDAKMARASARFMNYSRTGAQAFQTAIQEATAAKPFDFSTIKNREAIEARRAVARNVIQKNAELRAHFENSEKAMRQILAEEQFTPAEAESFLQSFLESTRRSLPIAARVRNANHSMMQAVLGMCDLLDREWGKWKALPDQSVQFTSPAASQAFAKLVATVQTAVAEEQKAAQELIASSRASSALNGPTLPRRRVLEAAR